MNSEWINEFIPKVTEEQTEVINEVRFVEENGEMVEKTFPTEITRIVDVTVAPNGWALTEWSGSPTHREIRRELTPQEIADKQAQQSALEVQQQAQAQITALKAQLAAMDYKTSKYADGEYTQQEWESIVTQRKAIRVQIRQLGG